MVKCLNRCIVSSYKHQSLLSVTVTILDKQVFMDLVELSVTEEEGGVKEKKGAPCSAVRGEGRRTRVQGWFAGGRVVLPHTFRSYNLISWVAQYSGSLRGYR